MIFKKLKRIERPRLINYILLLTIIIYSIIYGIFFYSLSYSIFSSIEGISIPDGYFNATLDSNNPEFEISISVPNEGFYEITNFDVNLTFDIVYYKNGENYSERFRALRKLLFIEKIAPFQKYQDTIIAEENEFNLTVLQDFNDYANLSKIVEYLLNIEIKSNYFYNLLKFEIEINDIILYIT